MSFQLGITGGIGAGKTLVCRIFSTLGIPVYNADERARTLIQQDPGIRAQIIKEFGESAYLNAGTLNRDYVARIVFEHREKLQTLNGIVHPVVKADYVSWQKVHSRSPITVREAAILFESGSDAGLDKIVAVSAPEKLRLARVSSRDGSSAERIRSVMENQMTEEERNSRSDYVIFNDDNHSVIQQVLNLITIINAQIGEHS